MSSETDEETEAEKSLNCCMGYNNRDGKKEESNKNVLFVLMMTTTATCRCRCQESINLIKHIILVYLRSRRSGCIVNHYLCYQLTSCTILRLNAFILFIYNNNMVIGILSYFYKYMRLDR